MRTSRYAKHDHRPALYVASAVLLACSLHASSATFAGQQPSGRTGLWITAVCGRGCKDSRQSCRAYVLSQREYDEEQSTKNKEFAPRGTTPLIVDDATPGTYYVAVECTIDTSVVPMETRGFPPITRPAFSKFFADDLPLTEERILFTSPETVEINGEKWRELFTAYRKWYRVTVEPGRRTPVVALFLEKQCDASGWEPFYPEGEAFSIAVPEEQRRTLWDALNDPGAANPTIDPKGRKVLSSLLQRGGRVCLPSPERGVIWVNNLGLLEATRVIPQDKIYQGEPPSVGLSPLRPATRPKTSVFRRP